MTIVDDAFSAASRRVPTSYDRETALAALRDARQHRDHYERVEALRLREARALGATVAELGAALGLKRGAIHARLRRG